MPAPDHSETPAARCPPREVFWNKLATLDRRFRRGYPRVHANVPVRFSGAPGGHVDTVSNDLSFRGLQVGCDRQTAARLRPDPAHGGEHATFGITLLLKVQGQALRVSGQARIVHVTLVPGAAPEEEVAIGVQLVDLADGGERALMRFIEHHMCPAGM